MGRPLGLVRMRTPPVPEGARPAFPQEDRLDPLLVPDRQGDDPAAPRGMYRNRRLAAILMSDAVGFSRLVQDDETGTLGALRAARRAMAQIASGYSGRIAGGAGDSILAEFPSTLAAVAAAIDFQTWIAQQNRAPSPCVALEFRIGIHIGDVVAEEGTILGDNVNLAARLQSTAEIGGILISRAVYDEIKGKLPVTFRPRGRLRLKNLSEFVASFDVQWRKPPRKTLRELPLLLSKQVARSMRRLPLSVIAALLTVAVAVACAAGWFAGLW